MKIFDELQLEIQGQFSHDHPLLQDCQTKRYIKRMFILDGQYIGD